jgi:hypothetical protein
MAVEPVFTKHFYLFIAKVRYLNLSKLLKDISSRSDSASYYTLTVVGILRKCPNLL